MALTPEREAKIREVAQDYSGSDLSQPYLAAIRDLLEGIDGLRTEVEKLREALAYISGSSDEAFIRNYARAALRHGRR